MPPDDDYDPGLAVRNAKPAASGMPPPSDDFDPGAVVRAQSGAGAAGAGAGSALSPWLRVPLGLASNALTGVEQGVGLLGNAEQLYNNTEYNLRSKLIDNGLLPSWLPKGQPDLTVLPTTQDMATGTDKLGVTNNPALAPQSTAERFAQGAARGAGAALTMPVGGAASALAAGVTGGAASEVPAALGFDSPWLSAAAGILGGLFGGGGAGLIGHAIQAHQDATQVAQTAAQLAAARAAQSEARIPAREAANAAQDELANAKAENAAALERADASSMAARDALVNEAKTRQANSAQSLETATNGVQNGIATSEAARDAQIAAAGQSAAKASEDAGASLENVAAKHGTSQTFQDAGNALQGDAQKWLAGNGPNTRRGLEGQVWGKLEEQVGDFDSIPAKPDNFVSYLENQLGQGGPLRDTIGKFAPQLADQLKDFLTKYGPKADEANGALDLEPVAAPSLKDLQQLRSAIGQAASSHSGPLRDIGAQQLDGAYSAVTKDMSSAIGSAAPENAQQNLALFDQANAETQRIRGIADGPMSMLVKGPTAAADNDAAGKVAKNLIGSGRAGDQDLASIREMLPNASNELAAAHIRSLADNPGPWLKPQASGGLSPEGKASLVPDPNDRAAIDQALLTRSSETATVKAQTAQAKADHSTNVDAAQAQLAAAKAQHEQVLAQTQADIDRANQWHSSNMNGLKALTAQANETKASEAQATARSLQAQADQHQLGVDKLNAALAAAKAKISPEKANSLLGHLNEGLGNLGLGGLANEGANQILGAAGGGVAPYIAPVAMFARPVLRAAVKVVGSPSNWRNAFVGESAARGPNPLFDSKNPP